MDELVELISKHFEYIYIKVFNYNDFIFKPSEKQIKSITNFIKLIDKNIGIDSIGPEWVFNFLVFGFKQRVEQKTRYKNKIPLNWVVGKKAFELYEKRGDSWMYWNSLFCTEYNIVSEKLTPKYSLENSTYDDEIRAKYIIDEMPLHLCLGTVVYSRKSRYCMVCKNKESCKIMNI